MRFLFFWTVDVGFIIWINHALGRPLYTFDAVIGIATFWNLVGFIQGDNRK